MAYPSYYNPNPNYYNPYQIYPNNLYNPVTYNQQSPFNNTPPTSNVQNMNVQPPQQTAETTPGIYGKIVDNFETITANDVPMSGATFFVKSDKSEIQMRSWNSGGSIDIIAYKTVPYPMNGNSANDLTALADAFDISTISETTAQFMKRLDDIDDKLDKLNKSSGNTRQINKQQREE